MNQNMVPKPLFEPQDENNPKNKHLDFHANKQSKQVDLKSQFSKISHTTDLQ